MDARKPTRQRRGLLRDERGSILIEFAFIGPLFILLLLGMLELALMVFSQTVLDGAARQAGRTVRTGHAQFSGVSTFTTALCSGLAAIQRHSRILRRQRQPAPPGVHARRAFDHQRRKGRVPPKIHHQGDRQSAGVDRTHQPKHRLGLRESGVDRRLPNRAV
jgi:hypothetical protein